MREKETGLWTSSCTVVFTRRNGKERGDIVTVISFEDFMFIKVLSV